MPEIHVSEETYARARKKAQERGYSSVDEYVAREIDTGFNAPEVESIFTPNVVAELQNAVVEYERDGNARPLDQAFDSIRGELKGKKAG